MDELREKRQLIITLVLITILILEHFKSIEISTKNKI